MSAKLICEVCHYVVCQSAHTATVMLPEVRYHREMARSRSACCIRTVTFTGANIDIAALKNKHKNINNNKK